MFRQLLYSISFIALLSEIRTQNTQDVCISIPKQQPTPSASPIGTPGKRGPLGPPGPKGEIGPSGPCVCDVDEQRRLQSEIDSLKENLVEVSSQFNNLRQSVESLNTKWKQSQQQIQSLTENQNIVQELISNVQQNISSAQDFTETVEEYRSIDPTFLCSVGMNDGRVADEDITASSSTPNHSPSFGRLNLQLSVASTSAAASWASRNVIGEWIQVNLRKSTKVTGVITQGRGRPGLEEWLTSYKISHSDDGRRFTFISAFDGSVRIFPGNHDRQTYKINRFPQPVVAQFFRLTVNGFRGWPLLRMDYLTC